MRAVKRKSTLRSPVPHPVSINQAKCPLLSAERRPCGEKCLLTGGRKAACCYRDRALLNEDLFFVGVFLRVFRPGWF